MSLSDGIVQARFTSGGRVYHYHCPEARIGDHIRSEGMYSTAAVVIGFGRTNGYTGYCRPAKVVQRGEPMTVSKQAALLKSIWTAESVSHQLYQTNELLIPIKKENPAMYDPNRIKEMERALKQEREHHKAARKAAAAKKAALKERKRLRKVAIATFEDVAYDLGQPAAARVAAAVELMKVSE